MEKEVNLCIGKITYDILYIIKNNLTGLFPTLEAANLIICTIG